MTNNKILYIVIAVLVVVGGGLFFFLGGQDKIETDQQTTAKPSTEASVPVTDTTMVDCSGQEDPGCFMNRMNGCLPVTVKMTGSDETSIEIIVLGVENEKCHFQRKLNNVLDMDCLFPKGTLNSNTLDQMFGNDKGLQKVVDDACSEPGW